MGDGRRSVEKITGYCKIRSFKQQIWEPQQKDTGAPSIRHRPLIVHVNITVTQAPHHYAFRESTKNSPFYNSTV